MQAAIEAHSEMWNRFTLACSEWNALSGYWQVSSILLTLEFCYLESSEGIPKEPLKSFTCNEGLKWVISYPTFNTDIAAVNVPEPIQQFISSKLHVQKLI